MIKLATTLFLLTSLISCSSKQKLVTNSYGNPIALDISFIPDNDLEDSLDDFLNLLRDVSIDAESIQIHITDKIENIKNDEIKRKLRNNRQAYYLKTKDNSLYIYSVHALGAQHGLYGYLKKLGYKWYFPGDLWQIKPLKKSWYVAVDEMSRPDFRSRRFFGGGGYPRNHVADPENYVMSSWETWQRRNRFGSDYPSKPHAWQDFIRRNKAEIEKHPEYVSESGKQLCVTNKNLQQLFIQDRFNRIEENRKRYGLQDPQALTIGVDPNDGGNHCNCKECLKLGSVSNRVFFLANLTAKAVKNRFSQIKVSLMAYNEHADPPDFILEDNIQVSIVPYKFQDVAAPEHFITIWKQHHHDIQVRDYWGVVIWTSGYPVGNFMDLAQKRMKTWSRLGVNQVFVESTYGIGIAGIPLYLMGQLGWKNNINSSELLKDLFVDLFGSEAGPIIESMMQRWSDTGLLLKYERYLSEHDFDEALALVKTDVQRKRINAFKEYFDFLLLQEKIESTKQNSEARKRELKNLVDYSYSIMDGLMIHSYWMPVPMTRIYDRESYNIRELRKKEKSNGPVYYKELNKNRIREYIEVENKNSKIYKDELKELYNDIEPKSPSGQTKSKKIRTLETFTLNKLAKGPSIFEYDIEVFKRNVTFKKAATIVSLYDNKGILISTKRYTPGRKYANERIIFPDKGTYEISFISSNVTAEIVMKDASGILLQNGTNIKY